MAGCLRKIGCLAVLLVAAAACFAHGRALWAAALVALAVVFHATYAIPSALLTLGFIASLALSGEGRRAVLAGLDRLALALAGRGD